jgi:hypothetical protein
MNNRMNIILYNMWVVLHNLAQHSNTHYYIEQPMFLNYHTKHHIQSMSLFDIQLLNNNHIDMFQDNLVDMYYNPLQNYRFHLHTLLLLAEAVADKIHNLQDKRNMFHHYYRSHLHSNRMVLMADRIHNPLNKRNSPHLHHKHHHHKKMKTQNIIVYK